MGDHTGEMLVLTATAAGAVDAITDEVRLGARGDNAPSLLNRIGYFSGGFSNDGHECRTTSFLSSTRTLSFSPAADNIVDEGDEMELWSIADRAGDVGSIHRLINESIRNVSGLSGAEVYDTATTFNWRSPQIDIPTGWSHLGGIDWTDRYGMVSEIRERDVLVRPSLRTVEIKGRGSALSNGRSVTLWGHLRSTALTDDTDETGVDGEWIVESVIGIMALAQSWKATDGGAAAERRANFWASRSADYRRKVGIARRGWSVPLP